MVKLGVEGEKVFYNYEILIEILKNLLPNNSTLKAAIITGFQVSEIHKTTVDFIIEEIFKSAK